MDTSEFRNDGKITAPNYRAGALWNCQVDGRPCNEPKGTKWTPMPRCNCGSCKGYRLAALWDAMPMEARQIIERA